MVQAKPLFSESFYYSHFYPLQLPCVQNFTVVYRDADPDDVAVGETTPDTWHVAGTLGSKNVRTALQG